MNLVYSIMLWNCSFFQKIDWWSEYGTFCRLFKSQLNNQFLIHYSNHHLNKKDLAFKQFLLFDCQSNCFAIQIPTVMIILNFFFTFVKPLFLLFFFSLPSSEIFPCGWTRLSCDGSLRHLAQPCCVALGWALICMAVSRVDHLMHLLSNCCWLDIIEYCNIDSKCYSCPLKCGKQ